MSKKRIFYIVFFTLLVVGFFYAITYAIPEFAHPKMKPISTVQPFAFTSQDGKTITEKDIAGQVTAVNYFFTTCKSVCPRMNNNLKEAYENFKNEPGFTLLSFTCDPQRDSVAQLKHYADSMGVDTKKWLFLTGRKDSLYAAARHSFHIDDPKNYVQNIEDDFMHTQFIALVNKKGEVVKIYDGIKASEVRQMETDIKTLLNE
jgi:protein SCO1/2